MATIIPLSDVADAMVEQLLDIAFGPGRVERTAYAIRDGVECLPALSFAALDEEEHLAGTIQCWPVALTDGSDKRHPLVMVGPVAVLPDLQNAGYGKAMMLAALKALEDGAGPQGALPQVMIGDPEYYGRFFGFTADHTGGWQAPGPVEPTRLLCRAANPAVLPRSGMLGPWRA